MQLIINGELCVVEEVETLAELLEQLGYEANAIAVAYNGSFVPRHNYAETILRDGQELEILMPMQGG